MRQPRKMIVRKAARHTPFVRDQPKIKPTNRATDGPGKKFKTCHGAGI